nr:pentatricopeptide repeat protein AaPPR819 [Agave angustifolia]
MPERSSVSWNAMIMGFSNWGELEQARLLSERIASPYVFSWTGMIDGYTRFHQPNRALALFSRMSEKSLMPNKITILAIVTSISNLGSLELAETMHAHCHKRALTTMDVRAESSLIDMYAKCRSIGNSKKVFDRMSERRNLVSWTSIITGFAAHGIVNEAIQLFDEMRKEENISPNR